MSPSFDNSLWHKITILFMQTEKCSTLKCSGIKTTKDVRSQEPQNNDWLTWSMNLEKMD